MSISTPNRATNGADSSQASARLPEGLAQQWGAARELGADYVVNAAEQDPAAEIQKLGGADAAIALAVAPRPFEQPFDSLARGGTLVMVALPPDNYVKLPTLGRTRVLARHGRSRRSTRRSTTSSTRATRSRASSSPCEHRPRTETNRQRRVSR